MISRARALELHLSIPQELRLSNQPIVRAIAAQRLLHEFHGEPHPLGTGWGLSSSLNDPLVSDQLPIANHEALLESMAKGTLLQVVAAARETSSFLKEPRPGAQLQRAGSREYWSAFSAGNTLAATYHYIVGRLAMNVIAVIPGFRVDDPFETGASPYTIDQLWVVKSSDDDDRLRLIAMVLDREDHLQRDHTRMDGILTALGYEVFRCAGWWARIDPQRLICEFAFAAGIPWPAPQLRTPSGSMIDAYRCYYCDDALARSSDGYGMVHHRSVFLHEGCFDSALDSDVFGGLPEDDTIPFSVLNFR